MIDAAVGAAVEAAEARFGEALDRHGELLRQMRAQLDSTARSVSQADERSEGLVHALRDIQGRAAGLDDAITPRGPTVRAGPRAGRASPATPGAAWMGQSCVLLGRKVGCIVDGMDDAERRAA